MKKDTCLGHPPQKIAEKYKILKRFPFSPCPTCTHSRTHRNPGNLARPDLLPAGHRKLGRAGATGLLQGTDGTHAALRIKREGANHLACHALQTDLDPMRVVAVGPVDETACNRVCVRGVYLFLSIG